MKQSISLDELEVYTKDTLDYNAAWHWLIKYIESQPKVRIYESKLQIERISEMIPAEWRGAPINSYRVDLEVGFDQREGPDYEFDSFSEELTPVWYISGIAYFDLKIKKELWKEFSLNHKIPYWSLSHWMYSQVNASEYLSKSFSQKIQGLSLSHINSKDAELLARFQEKENWKHWDYLEWHWLRDDRNSYNILPWIEVLNEKKLRSFGLQYCQLGEAGYEKLGGLKGFWKELEYLKLNNVYFGGVELEAILNSSPKVQNLKSLSLDDSSLSNGGKEELKPEHFVTMAKSGWFDRLERLHLRYHTLGRHGITALGESKAVETLQYLKLEVGRLDDEQILLMDNFDWKNLKYISFSFNSKITKEGLEKFQQTKVYEKCRYVYIELNGGKSLSKGSLFF